MNIKKGTALLLAASLFNFPAASLSAEETDYLDEYYYFEEDYSDKDDYIPSKLIRGDVNFDGKVDQTDASFIMNELISLDLTGKSLFSDLYTEYKLKIIYYVGDVDQSDDGKIFDITDATMILKAILEADMEGEDEITDEIWNKVTGHDYSVIGALWIAGTHKIEDELIFNCVTGDKDITNLTFKVKDNVPDGFYEITYSVPPYIRESAFCDSDTNALIPEIYNGTIGINKEVQPVDYGNKFSFITGSKSVKPGETFTITCSVKNIPTELAALNFYLKYDRNIFEFVSAEVSDDLEKNGDFVAASND